MEQTVARATAGLISSWATLARASGEMPYPIDGWVAMRTGGPAPQNNQAILIEPCVDPDAALAAVIRFFDERSLPFMLQVPAGLDLTSEHTIADEGFSFVEEEPLMIWDVDVAALPDTSGVAVHRLDDDQELERFIETAAAGFGIPPEAGRAFATPEVFRHPAMSMFLATIDGRPVGTAQTSALDEVVGVFSVATVPEARRRGVARAATAACLRHAAEQGCDLAFLQASAKGQPLYEQMGFRPVQPYRMYARP